MMQTRSNREESSRLRNRVKDDVIVKQGENSEATQPRVLVIDDEQLLGQTIQLGLEDTMTVSVETSGEKGLARLLSSEQFELILCDLSLPDLSGIEIFARASAAKPEIAERFVVMTGGAVSQESRDFLDNYHGALLNKPFTLTQLENLAQSLIDRNRA